MAKIPAGIFSRGRKLALAATKIAVQEASSRIKSWESERAKLEGQIELARTLVKTLSELKGASLKMGQLLSLDLGDFLPPQVVSVLESLHQNVTAHPYAEMESIMKKDLQERFFELEDISDKAFASASIGQVHRAQLRGRDVILKIQYPGVKDTIPSDLKVLRFILSQGAFFQRKDIDWGPLLSEIETVLLLETDYRNELKMLKLYRENFQGTEYVVPEAFDEFSSENVLCMEFIDGIKLTDWIPAASVAEREAMADKLVRLYLKEFFEHGLVQTDPNPGNFLVTPDGRLALLDFGSVKQFDPEFIAGYRRITAATIGGNKQEIIEESLRLGLIDPRESEETREVFLKLMEISVEFFQKDTQIDLGDKNYAERTQRAVWDYIRSSRYSPPPKEIIFLHRKLGGLFVLIKRLGVPMNVHAYWKSIY